MIKNPKKKYPPDISVNRWRCHLMNSGGYMSSAFICRLRTSGHSGVKLSDVGFRITTRAVRK